MEIIRGKTDELDGKALIRYCHRNQIDIKVTWPEEDTAEIELDGPLPDGNHTVIRGP